MAIVPNAAGFEIYAVTPGGPAEAAGIKKGDIVTDVDGAPATGIALAEIRRRQRTDPPGGTITFHIADGRDAPVVLRDQICTAGVAKAGPLPYYSPPAIRSGDPCRFIAPR